MSYSKSTLVKGLKRCLNQVSRKSALIKDLKCVLRKLLKSAVIKDLKKVP